jgi:hypothetical protein
MAATVYISAPKSPVRILIARWFFTGIALAMIAICLLSFIPAITHPAGRHAPLSILAAAHGTVFLLWLLLFLVQSSLVATRHMTWHRRLGLASVVILVLAIALTYSTTLAMVHRGYDLSGDLSFARDPAEGAIFPLANLFIFSVLSIAALAYRRRPELHRRLMLFANVELMPAPLAHLIGHTPWLAALPAAIVMVPITVFVALAIARDLLVQGRVHPLTLVLAGLRMVSGPLEAGPIGTSAGWHHFVYWLGH